MPQLSPLVGALVGSSSYEYDSFKADDGKTVPGGTSRHVFVATALEDVPAKVKITAAQWPTFESAGYGAEVDLSVFPVAKNNRVEWVCHEVVSVQPVASAA